MSPVGSASGMGGPVGMVPGGAFMPWKPAWFGRYLAPGEPMGMAAIVAGCLPPHIVASPAAAFMGWTGRSPELGARVAIASLLGVGAVLGGMLASSLVRNRHVGHAGRAGLLSAFLPNPFIGWVAPIGLSLFDGSMFLVPFGLGGLGALGGWLQQRAVTLGVARSPRRTWDYVTRKGRSLRASDPSRARGLDAFWRALGLIFLCGSAGMIFLMLCFAAIAKHDGLPFNVAAQLRDVFLIVVGGAVGWFLYKLGSRTPSASVSDLLDDQRAPIIYLRSFRDDGLAAPLSRWEQVLAFPLALWNRPYEEHMARLLGGYGPFVAIGRPDETLPESGAARLYVSHEEWKEVAEDLIDRARLVVVQVGETPGLRWELKRVAELARPEEVLVFLPYALTRSRRKREEAHRAFLEWGRACLPGPIPEELGRSAFLYFPADSSWSATPLAFRHRGPIGHPEGEILHRLANHCSLRPRPFFSGTMILLLIMLIMLLLAVAGLALLAYALLASLRDWGPMSTAH